MRTSKLKPMTDEEKAAAESPDSVCDCEICEKRRNDGLGKSPVAPGMRSGKKRTWDDKYGPGRTL